MKLQHFLADKQLLHKNNIHYVQCVLKIKSISFIVWLHIMGCLWVQVLATNTVLFTYMTHTTLYIKCNVHSNFNHGIILINRTCYSFYPSIYLA